LSIFLLVWPSSPGFSGLRDGFLGGIIRADVGNLLWLYRHRVKMNLAAITTAPLFYSPFLKLEVTKGN
jgi:hypothetical protein